jgi:hypothetical protein
MPRLPAATADRGEKTSGGDFHALKIDWLSEDRWLASWRRALVLGTGLCGSKIRSSKKRDDGRLSR